MFNFFRENLNYKICICILCVLIPFDLYQYFKFGDEFETVCKLIDYDVPLCDKYGEWWNLKKIFFDSYIFIWVFVFAYFSDENYKN